MRPKNDLASVKSITAIEALARRGMTLPRAKRAIEAMIEKGVAVVDVPLVEDVMTFYDELAKAGVGAASMASGGMDVRAIRTKLGLSQAEFAKRYNLDLDAIQNWEQGRRTPDRTSLSYLRVIAAFPEHAAKAQEELSSALDDLS